MGRRAEGLIDFIAERYRRAAEIGIGRCADVAAALAMRGVSVFGTDVVRIPHHEVEVFVDDVTMPRRSLYRGVELVYSLRTPEELFAPIARLAHELSADAIVSPLSSEYPEGWELMRYGSSTFFIMSKTRHRLPALPPRVSEISLRCGRGREANGGGHGAGRYAMKRGTAP